MTKIELKGVAKVTARGRTYYYAWRGGPRLRGKPGAPEFMQAYQEALDARRTVSTDRFLSVVVAYKASPDYAKLADSTKGKWGPWCDRIADYFGELRTAQFDRPEKIRPIIRQWRSKWSDKPRTADYGLQVLSRVCAHAVDPLGKIASNPCEGIKQLYKNDRSEIIWLDSDITQLRTASSVEVVQAVDLAAATGLRLGDLMRLSWSHIQDDAIVLSTGKSRGKREAIIPLYDGLRDLLARIPKRATTILTSSKRRPWTVDGFQTSFGKSKHDARMADRNLHFHDLKGTAVTRFYIAGIPERVIAEIVGWEEETVHRIIRRYVGRAAATKALIQQINRGT